MPTSAIGNTYTPPAYQEKPQSSSSLDKNGFLKMLTEQIKNQDPQSNQDPSQYFQTVSMMTMVEQLTNLSTHTESMLQDNKVVAAESLLGRTVTYKNSDGDAITGVVDGVDLNHGDPTVSVGGVAGIKPALISTIK